MADSVGIRRDVVIAVRPDGSAVVYKWDLLGDGSGKEDGWVLIPGLGTPAWPIITQDVGVMTSWLGRK